MMSAKLIDANDFYEKLTKKAFTRDDRKFCEKVKKALDEQEEIILKNPIPSVGEWEVVGTETGALGIKYTMKKCSRCGFTHSLIIPDNFCPKCGQKKINARLDILLKNRV